MKKIFVALALLFSTTGLFAHNLMNAVSENVQKREVAQVKKQLADPCIIRIVTTVDGVKYDVTLELHGINAVQCGLLKTAVKIALQ